MQTGHPRGKINEDKLLITNIMYAKIFQTSPVSTVRQAHPTFQHATFNKAQLQYQHSAGSAGEINNHIRPAEKFTHVILRQGFRAASLTCHFNLILIWNSQTLVSAPFSLWWMANISHMARPTQMAQQIFLIRPFPSEKQKQQQRITRIMIFSWCGHMVHLQWESSKSDDAACFFFHF